MKVLDLSENRIEEKTIREFLLPCLKVNKTLTNVDLRHNPGYVGLNKQQISLYLLKNIERMKKAGADLI